MHECVVVGAGVIGCSIALALTKAGRSCLVIDALPSAGYGSTSASAAIIRPYYSTFAGTALAHEGHHRWLAWCDDATHQAEGLHYEQCGCIMLKTVENGELKLTASLLARAGVSYSELDPDQLKARMPGLVVDSFHPPRRIEDLTFGVPNQRRLRGALLCPGGYINDPQLATQQIAAAAKSAGARFLFGRRLVAINADDSKVQSITLEDGAEVRVDVLINAAGPHSAKVNALAGVDPSRTIVTRAMIQEVNQLPRPANYADQTAGYILTDTDVGVYMRPEGGRHLLVGSLEPECDPVRWVDPDAFTPQMSEQWTNQAWRAALRFPGLAIPNQAQGIVALYDVSDDWLPIYDSSDIPGFYMAIGTSGNQFKNALVVGDIMATLVVNGWEAEFAPPFDLPMTGQKIDLKVFSRRRALNRQSSFSVLG